MKSSLSEYPCNTCLVRAACNNFKCPIIEEYLTLYYRYVTILPADSLSNFSRTVPPVLKKAMEYLLVGHETKFIYMYKGSPFTGGMINIKNQYYMLEKTIDDKIKILSKF